MDVREKLAELQAAATAAERRMIMRLIDADKFEVYSFTRTSLDFDAGVLSVLEKLDAAPTVDAVPVSELKKLRDYLYAEDLIFMRGLAELNKLIANYGAKMDEVIE